MRLPFSPNFLPNQLGGSDLRSGCGELLGVVAYVMSARKYVAWISGATHTLPGEWEREDDAQDALLAALAA